MIVRYNSYILLYQSFSYAMTYIYCRKNPEQTFNALGVFKLKASQFIWFYLVFKVLLKNSIENLLVGLVVGHMYIYLKEVLPVQTRKEYLKTPQFLFFYKKKVCSLRAEEIQ